MLSKRTPDAVRILCDYIEAGLRKGYCTANDIRTREFQERNIIGGATKCLPQVGFVKSDRYIKATHQKAHGRMIAVWELRDRGKAESYVNALRVHLTSINPERKQLTLWEAA